MATRLIYAVFVVVAVAIGTLGLWTALTRSNEQQIARIAEAESYSARSQLIRSTEAMISALHNVRIYWSANGQRQTLRRPRADGIDMTNLAGIPLILWDDPAQGVRFLRSADSAIFDYRPTDDEWARFEALTARAMKLEQNALLGPYANDDGNVFFEVYLVEKDDGVSGNVVALLDAREALERMLVDVSPGYAIRVLAGDMLLYERGTAAPDAPASWTRSGMIRSSLDSLWSVEHSPTAGLVASIDSPAVDLVLLLGLFISVLLGTLVYENGRARLRAAAAEAAEAELADLNRNLEENIAERTRQLRDRTADLQTLADSVAHDLRNPLNSLSVNAQLLEERARLELSPESMRVLGRFTPSVNQMANILDRLLGLSEVSHATFCRETVDMRNLTEEIVEDLSGAEPPPPVRFQVDDLPAAYADPTLVHMLLTNLLANAIKYTRTRQSRIVTVGFEARDGETVYYVADNGVGFDQDHADTIFGAFNRLDKASSSEGIGLGLTIAHRVVERHDGKIWAQGRVGEGATFYFSLGSTAGNRASQSLSA